RRPRSESNAEPESNSAAERKAFHQGRRRAEKSGGLFPRTCANEKARAATSDGQDVTREKRKSRATIRRRSESLSPPDSQYRFATIRLSRRPARPNPARPGLNRANRCALCLDLNFRRRAEGK